ncbi:MAG: phosphatidylserine decarboxylase family protein [Dysgonamonadaceae bacterium]|jgi:phosphatidylserine decarboxylase|nr:phosphatidylserine decarboxylase family protein [Dysgonamonadaceae bacterium]
MKVHKEGNNILLVLFLILLLISAGVCYFSGKSFPSYGVCTASALFFLVVLNFFRSPRRIFPGDTDRTVVAAADGTIVAIEEVTEHEYFHDKRILVSIFMSLFNVHANWFPVEGKVIHVSHQNGRFMAAYLPKSSTENERSTVVIETKNGEKILARQIAGAMARRIVTYAEIGEECHINDQMGFIKFGSRVDIYLPLNTKILVEMGQQVKGDITSVAKLH